MSPLFHLGSTLAIAATAKILGNNSIEITLQPNNLFVGIIIGGVLIDADYVFDKLHRWITKKEDVIAPWRIFHGPCIFIFSLILAYIYKSPWPAVAALFHLIIDTTIPAIISNTDGKSYSSHSIWLWITFPETKQLEMVRKKWLVTYPLRFNKVHERVYPLIGLCLAVISILIILFV